MIALIYYRKSLLLDNDLYPFIISRHSIRSYDQRPFETDDRVRVELILKNTQPLFPENEFHVLFQSKEKGEDLVSVLGAYGRFITPPYYLLPYLIGEEQVYVELGYRVEQIAIQLWSRGIGSCFIGCLSRQEKVRKDFQLPDNAHFAAFLVIGYPSEKFGLDKITKKMRSITGIPNRLPVDEICFRESFDQHYKPSGNWQKIIEAGCMAPSAVNAQPWRFLRRNNDLYLFSIQDYRKYLLPENRQYGLHDCGICMANIDMALASMDIRREWWFFNGSIDDDFNYPGNLFPLAKLKIKQLADK